MKAGGKAPAVATEGTEPPDGFLSEGYLWFQFRRGLMKLAFMVAVTTFELYRYGVLTKGHFLALLSPLRWLAGLLLAARVASMICSQLLCRWVWWRDAPGLQGRVAVVTGGSAGVGHEAALQLALLGATVVIGVRSAQRGRAAEEALTSRIREKASQVPGAVLGRVEYVSLDLASLASVRAFAATVTTKYKRIDVLVNKCARPGPATRTRSLGRPTMCPSDCCVFAHLPIHPPTAAANALARKQAVVIWWHARARGWCGSSSVQFDKLLLLYRGVTAPESTAGACSPAMASPATASRRSSA